MTELIELLDWKRRIFDLYHGVRSEVSPPKAWQEWRTTRDALFKTHPQSPLSPGSRESFDGLGYFDYDPEARSHGAIADADPARYEIATSTGSTHSFTRFATVGFTLKKRELSLELYWLEGYGGGLFLPFRDATNGMETYGGGRYLLDTVKGSDLGMEDGKLVLDFNFAYNPSCAYDPRWVCPLSPPANRLDVPVRAGERSPD